LKAIGLFCTSVALAGTLAVASVQAQEPANWQAQAQAGPTAPALEAVSDTTRPALVELSQTAAGQTHFTQSDDAQVVVAPRSGVLVRQEALPFGIAAWRLGAGRERKEDPVSAAAGIICLVKPGERVTKGQPILELRTDQEQRFAIAIAALDGAATISGQQPPRPAPLVIEHIG